MESMTSLRYIILTSVFFIMIVVVMDLTMICNYFSIKQVHGNPFLVNNTSIYDTWMEGIKQPNSETMDTNNDSILIPDIILSLVTNSSGWKFDGALATILTYPLQDEEDWNIKSSIKHNENWYYCN